MFGCHLSVPFQPCCGSSPRTNAWRFGGSSLVGDDGFYVGCFPLFGWKSPQVTRFCFVFVFFVCLERGSYPSTPVNLSIHLLALVDLYMHIKQIWGTKVTTVIQSHKSHNQKKTLDNSINTCGSAKLWFLAPTSCFVGISVLHLDQPPPRNIAKGNISAGIVCDCLKQIQPTINKHQTQNNTKYTKSTTTSTTPLHGERINLPNPGHQVFTCLCSLEGFHHPRRNVGWPCGFMEISGMQQKHGSP